MPKQLNTRDPDVRNFIISEYHKHDEKYIEKTFGVSRQDIKNWKTLLASTGSLAPRFHMSGRNVELTPREIKKLENKLIIDPFATNAELAAVVNNKITPRAAGNYISRSKLQFTKKLESRDVEASFTRENAQLGMKFIKKIERIPLYKRIYVDETYASAGIKRRTGRFPKGKTRWSKQNRKYPRMTIICAATQNHWLHKSKIFNKGSISTKDFEEYVSRILCPKIKEGDFVIWDRLGKSGRAANPQAHHFSPKAKASIERKGATLIMLPPYGKYMDPIEELFGDTKKKFEKFMATKMMSCDSSKIPFSEKVSLWHKAVDAISEDSFKRAFHERANGQEFIRVYKERGLIDNDQ
jgi:transposase